MRNEKDTIKNEPMGWLKYYSEQDANNVINYVNECLDRVVAERAMLRFNQPYNSFADVYSMLLEYAKIEVAPVIDTDSKTLEMYNSLVCYDNELPHIVYIYCKKVFNKLTFLTSDVKFCENLIKKPL